MAVLKANKCFGRKIGMERGVKQGDPLVPKISNIVVDALVRVVLLEVCRSEEAYQGLSWATGEHNIIFYVDDGRIVGAQYHLSPENLAAVIRMFNMAVLLTNHGETKAVLCTPIFIWGQQGTSAYKSILTV